MKRSRRLLAAVPLAVLLIAGCGGGAGGVGRAPSASSLVSQMKTAVQHARSMRVSGTITSGGKTFHLNLRMTKSGEYAGQMSVGSASFTLLSTHGKTYLKVTSAFLKYVHAPTSVCPLMCHKYMLAPGSLAKGLTSSLGWKSLTGDMTKKTGDPSRMTVSGPVTVDGQQAWVLSSPDGSKGYIAASGTPYLLRVVPPTGQKGRVDFTQWNSVTIPGPPPASQVVDLSSIMSG